MSDIKECKEYKENIKNFDQRLTQLIKDVSEKGTDIQSRYQQTDDEELAVVADLYRGFCTELKEVRKNSDQFSRIASSLESRLKRLKAAKPGFFERLFHRKRLKAVRKQLKAAKVAP